MIKKYLWSSLKRKYMTIGIATLLCICLWNVVLLTLYHIDLNQSGGNPSGAILEQVTNPSDVTSGQVTHPAEVESGKVVALNSLAGRTDMSISQGYINWNFSQSGEDFSLSSGSQGSLESKNGALGWEVSQGDQLLTPSGLEIPTKSVSTIEIRMMSTTATSFTVSWRTKDGSFRESAKATIEIKADGELHDYQIELGQHSEWPEDGKIDQLMFETSEGGDVCFDFFRLSGIYVVPFPGISGNFETDVKQLNALRETYSDLAPGVVLGFSTRIEYLADTDGNGNYVHYNGQSASYMNIVDPYYYLRLAKETGMPVMLWLRGDPWGDLAGVYRELRLDKNNYMWTAATTDPAYINNETGYAYLSLAQKDLNGETTAYWEATDKLLGQCAQVIAQLIADNPDCFLGVTTTSELKYNATDTSIDLDYNPNTIKEFADYCSAKYGSIEELNAACGTDFATFSLKSTDYDPNTVENPDGFDAPRVRDDSAFWTLWTAFRTQQVSDAVARQVNTVAQYIDAKYIWTHQIAIGQDPFVSPEEAGDVNGSNVGIDMFNHEVTVELVKKISSFVKDDYSRTWGVPEWLVMRDTHKNTSYAALEIMDSYGVKYICPFWWGVNGNEYDLKGTGAEEGIVEYLRNLK